MSPELSSSRKVRYLQDIYSSCDVAYFLCESPRFHEAFKEEGWIRTMDEEMDMIEKNKK